MGGLGGCGGGLGFLLAGEGCDWREFLNGVGKGVVVLSGWFGLRGLRRMGLVLGFIYVGYIYCYGGIKVVARGPKRSVYNILGS